MMCGKFQLVLPSCHWHQMSRLAMRSLLEHKQLLHGISVDLCNIAHLIGPVVLVETVSAGQQLASLTVVLQLFFLMIRLGTESFSYWFRYGWK